MPRFRWENFTNADGLPDDHVFNVCVDGDRVWAATENGLGLYENGKWKIYRPAGRPGPPRGPRRRGRSAHRSRLGRHHGRLEPPLRRPFRQFHPAQQRPAQRRGLWRRRAGRLRVGRHCRRRRPPRHAHRPVVPVQRAQHPDVRDLDLQRQRRHEQGLLRGLGRRRARIRREDRALERLQRSRRRDRNGASKRTRA